MPRKNRRRRNQMPRRKVSKKTRRSGRRRKSTSSGIGKLVASGIRTLTSYLPGSEFLQPIADFGLKALGVTKTTVVKDSSGNVTADDVHIYALGALFMLCPRNLVVSSKIGVRAGLQKTPTSKRTFETCYTDFSEIFVRSVRLELRPEGAVGQRCGNWMFAFQVAYSEQEAIEQKTFNATPNPWHMQNATRYARGPANKPLILNWNARVSDGGHVNSFRHSDAPIGQVMIYFEDHARDIGTDFKPSEISCSVHVSGTFVTRGTQPYGVGTGDDLIHIYDQIDDNLSSTGVTVYDGSKYHVFKTGYVVTVKDSKTVCKFVGRYLDAELTLEDLAIE